MHVPVVRHQESHFNHPVVENYVKAKGKVEDFLLHKPRRIVYEKITLLK